MPITVFKKHNSKPNQSPTPCKIACESIKVGHNGRGLYINFTSGTENRASDFCIIIDGEARQAVISELVLSYNNSYGKDLHDYSKEELLEAYTDKIKEECGT